MTNAINNNNNTVDAATLAMLQQFITEHQVTPEMLKAVAKQQKNNFVYSDAANHIAVCNSCGEEFNTDDIPATFVDACKKSGICPKCAEAFARVETLKANLRNKNISAHGSKVVIHGGKNVGARLKAMFSDVIKSENFTEEMLAQFMDPDYSNQALKFSSYPFVTDVTGVSEAEIKENREYYKRFYSKPYEIFGRTVKLCSQIFDKQLEASQAEFKKLGLIAEDAQY